MRSLAAPDTIGDGARVICCACKQMDFITNSLLGGSDRRSPGLLESVVAKVLQKVLGAFVRGLDEENLELSVWNGDVRLSNLQLRTEVLDALPLPVRVLGGSLGEVRVSVPWRNLLGGEPMLLTVDSVLVLMTVPSGDETAAGSKAGEDTEAEAEAKRALADVAEAAEEQADVQAQMGPSMVDRLVHALLQKLQVSVTNVHVRLVGGPVPGDDRSHMHAVHMRLMHVRAHGYACARETRRWAATRLA